MLWCRPPRGGADSIIPSNQDGKLQVAKRKQADFFVLKTGGYGAVASVQSGLATLYVSWAR